MKKFFLIPLLTLTCSVMAFAEGHASYQEGDVAQITIGGETTYYETASDLKTAVAALPTDGTVATITLLDDVDGGIMNAANKSALVFPANTKSVLDLNGHVLSATLNLTDKNARKTTYVIDNKGELTINDSGSNGKIKNNLANMTSSHDCIRVINNGAGATLTLNKCIINNGAMGIDNYGALTINEGVTIEVGQGSTSTMVGQAYGNTNGGNAICMRGGSTNTINGGIIKSHTFQSIMALGTAIVTINGGDFYGVEGFGWINYSLNNKSQLTISGGTFDVNPIEYVDQDHYIDLEDGRYVVKAYPDPIVATVYTLEELKENLNQATNVQTVQVTLGDDINVTEEVTLQHGSQLTIPAGRTLTVQDGGLFVNEGRTINNGTISTIDNGFFSKPASVQGSGTISISNLSITEEGNVVTYNISNGMQLQYLAYLAAQDAYADKTWNISLTTDINLPANAIFEPISRIEGTFEGNNHVINNLKMISESSDCALIYYFEGTFQNVILNNVNINTGGLASGLFLKLYPNSIVKNVKVNGSITSALNYATGFVSSEYQVDLTESRLWFVNCVNNANVSSGASFAGGFFGTVSSSTGTIGLYNCENNGNIIGGYAGAILAYGYGASLDMISFKNTGTITSASTSSPWIFGDVVYMAVATPRTSRTSANNYDLLDAEKYIAVYNGAEYVARLAGVIDNKQDAQETETTTSDWSLSSTWTNDTYVPIVPSESDSVNVTKSGDGVFVTNNTEAVAKAVTVETSLTIQDGGSLTIGEKGLTIKDGATVKVEQGAKLVIGGNEDAEVNKGGITIEGTGKLIIEATEEGGTGVVLVDPAAKEEDTHVYAEIELIPDAHKDGSKYVYRYFGIPLYFEPGQEFTAANWEKEPLQDGESTTTYFRPWVNGAWAGDLEHGLADLVPFKGYGISNESTHGVKYTFKGKLVGNGDGTMNFVNGFNLFANSYTAPINIQTLLNGFTNEDVKATIYMFQGKRLRSVSKADFAGYRTPRFTVIPSMQAFFVLMDDGTSAEEIVDYSEAVFNNSLPNSGLYAPKRQETPEFNRVRINIVDENGENDEVYLIEAADFTSDFENGYDEVKYMNNGLNLFATTAYGHQTTEITNDINGTFIGIQGNGTYTMSFDELVGEEYQIRDLQTNAVVAMSEANTYTFTANGTNDSRFVVESIAKMPTSVDNVSEAKLFINNNTLYISENNSNANIMIYAANGQLVLDEVAQPTVSLNGLASGVYTVRVANQTLKFVK